MNEMNIGLNLEAYRDKQIIVFGTGNMAKIIVENKEDCLFFVDNDKSKWGSLFHDRPVYSPSILADQDMDSFIIIVASMHYNQIADQLLGLGLKSNIHFIDGRPLYRSIIARKSYKERTEYNSDNCPAYDENILRNRSCSIAKELSEVNAFLKNQYMKASRKTDSFIEYDEDFQMILRKDDPKIIAFYLPQFHTIPENNKWWGRGFTEWTNVTRALPLFEGHHQPQLPIDLGFYDLSNINVMKRQIELAKKYGIHGFCFYHYWFNGKRLLELPVENFFNNKDMDFNYCLCWANENWTRRWDGQENEILIAQEYSEEDDIAFIGCIEKYLRDSRYIRINNKPILLVYRPQLLPEPDKTLARWREYCRRSGIGEIYLIACKAFKLENPTDMGFDAAVEFPPNNMYNIKPVNEELTIFNSEYKGMAVDLKDWIQFERHMKVPECKTFKTAFPAWDNTARRPNESTIFHNSSPELYKRWLKDNIIYSKEHMYNDERIVFVNAWNEWAEGAHLEPDSRHGYANLKATSEAILETRSSTTRKILLVFDNKDAENEKWFFDIVRHLKKMFKYEIEIIFFKRTNDYMNYPLEKYAYVYEVNIEEDYLSKLDDYIKDLCARGFKSAIYNINSDMADVFNMLTANSYSVVALPNHSAGKSLKDYVYDLLTDIGDKYKKVSVILPNYNYGNYIKGRLNSIINQSYPIYELIILDDCSQDNSIENMKQVLENMKLLEYNLIDHKIIINEENSKSVFKQWIKGLQEVQGEYIWIAEADDLCQRTFVEKITRLFDMDDNVVLAYSQSKQINENDDIMYEDYSNYTDEIDCEKWKKSYVRSGIEEIRDTLVIKNTIPNTSAVIFKNFIISDIIDELIQFRVGGDWYFYVWLLQKGMIAFCSEPLNFHRRHTKSVSSDSDDTSSCKAHFQEVVWLQDYIIEKFSIDEDAKQKAYRYRDKLKLIWNIRAI